ncbi:V-type ATP synthase subunit I [Caldisericum exile]|uniref:V-type ATP synthase subunit I n=1 Tax=Caldisericum exile (strain DSM 21853 / NBRC 104410 / AZM16c01) TaxID=511051 RepID=A0A7U6JG61_CALEA|nr:V-type ATP synthase subunit I [Caldisericum exile]BAL81289.1 V-type ATP synthase subunit I [Caldisericum exile AZM16c01]
MAIEKVKKIAIVGSSDRKKELLDTLFDLNTFHLESVSEEIISNYNNFKTAIPEHTFDDELYKISVIFSIFKEFNLEKQGFIQGFLPQDFDVDIEEFSDVVNNYNLDKLYKEITFLRNRYHELEGEISKLLEEKKNLALFSNFPFQFSILKGTKQTSSFIGLVNTKNLTKFQSDVRTQDLFVHVFESDKNKSKVFVLFVKDEKDFVDQIIKDYSIEILMPLESFSGYFEEEAQRIEKKLQELSGEQNVIVSKLTEFYSEKRKLLILEDYFRSLNLKESSMLHFLEGKTVLVVRGYVKEEQYTRFVSVISKLNFISFELETDSNDLVPVSLRNSPIFRPFEFLIRLFGLPSYSNIDPTMVVAILFTTFFGFALGDAGYGLIVALFGILFAMKYKRNIGAWKFFMILFYGGVSSIIIGLLTNSFFGNLFATYFPNFILSKLMSKIQVIDPTSPNGSVQFMVLSLIIGFTSQMVGVLISIIVKIKNRSYLDAIFNGLGWLLFLPGLVLLVIVGLNPALKLLDNILLSVGLMLILIGGWMSIRTPLFKPIAALVNLYGIRSSYGISGFLGDTLSYLRLFALGLSSGILASSFNLMAKVIGEMLGPVGILVTLLVLFALHALALFMNVLGAFIHSMRLNFLEFFGRFYDLGGYEFKPLGFEFKNIRLNKKH